MTGGTFARVMFALLVGAVSAAAPPAAGAAVNPPRALDATQGVTRFEVTSREPFAGGRSFGRVGPYERLDGTATVQLDPRDPHNAGIVNIDRASRNAAGMVEYSTPVFILRPADMGRGNGKIFYAVNNRGNKQALGYFNRVTSGPGINDPRTSADAGDGFLMRKGYTVVDAGWQGDVAAGDNRLFPDFPVASQAD